MKTRKEERYYIEKSKIKEFIEGIKSISHPKVFQTEYNQTLYFNNSEHEVPFGVSIKARKYSDSTWGGYFKLNANEEWIFEIKKDLILKNTRLRQKERKNVKLEEILRILQNIKEFPITLPLRPYVADSYSRKHYIINEGDEFRITIDDELKYYFLESGFEGIEIGNEDYIRIEVKIPQDKLKSVKSQKISKLLQTLEAEPIVSKKDMAYNLLSKYIRNKFNERVETSDTEIEAKLSLSGEDQYIFHKIKNDFYKGFIKGFKIPENFPYTLESGRLHRYVITPNNKYTRIGLKGKSKKVTSKENFKIVDDPFSLNCIIKRSETKEPLSLKLLELPSRMLYRKRKYFIVQNKESKKTYCILIDRCTCDAHELFQMEIEGLLLSPSGDKEREIIRDIAYMTNEILEKYKVLKPTTLMKLDWLKGLKLKSEDWHNSAAG